MRLVGLDDTRPYLLGGMSGTSTDGVDVALLKVDLLNSRYQYLGCTSLPFTESLQQDLIALQGKPASATMQDDWLLPMLSARQALADEYAKAAIKVMQDFQVEPHQVAAFGVHGQTLRHRPDLAMTYQMMDASRVAVHTGVPVVSDFRSQDVAYGGQGAPLVPSFHAAWLKQSAATTRYAVLNLGGFANLTLLDEHGAVVAGGDCGPANVLLDAWCQERFDQRFDEGGQLALRGQVHEKLLDRCKNHPFFSKGWPSSTGRDDFHMPWLKEQLHALDVNDFDVLTTLVALTAWCVHKHLPSEPVEVVLAGGGAWNQAVVQSLKASPMVRKVSTFTDKGLPVQAVEAAAFAWFAGQFLTGGRIVCQVVTGAKRVGVSGVLSLP